MGRCSMASAADDITDQRASLNSREAGVEGGMEPCFVLASAVLLQNRDEENVKMSSLAWNHFGKVRCFD